jgi:hypothetical protein
MGTITLTLLLLLAALYFVAYCVKDGRGWLIWLIFEMTP